MSKIKRSRINLALMCNIYLLTAQPRIKPINLDKIIMHKLQLKARKSKEINPLSQQEQVAIN